MSDEHAKLLAETLRCLRIERVLTQTDVARFMADKGFAWHQPTVQRVEAGEREVRASELVALAELYGQSVSGLLRIDGAVPVTAGYHAISAVVRGMSTEDLIRLNAVVASVLLGRQQAGGAS